jgi:hypothetical protein
MDFGGGSRATARLNQQFCRAGFNVNFVHTLTGSKLCRGAILLRPNHSKQQRRLPRRRIIKPLALSTLAKVYHQTQGHVMKPSQGLKPRTLIEIPTPLRYS